MGPTEVVHFDDLLASRTFALSGLLPDHGPSNGYYGRVNDYIGANPLEGHRYLALIELVQAGHIDEAFGTLDNFLAANEHLDEDGELRGRILCQKALFASLGERWSEAVEFCRSAEPFLRERSIFLTNQAGLARGLAAIGDFDSALQVLDQALAISATELWNVLGLLWHYVHIAEQTGSTVPERYRDLFLKSCQVHCVQLPPEIEHHPSLKQAILTAHQMVRDSQRRRQHESPPG